MLIWPGFFVSSSASSVFLTGWYVYVCLFGGVRVSGSVKSLSAGLSASMLVVGVVPCFSCCGTCRYMPVTPVIEFSRVEAVMFSGVRVCELALRSIRPQIRLRFHKSNKN